VPSRRASLCRASPSVPRPVSWDPTSAECQRVTGFIFDCDGTIYQPSGMVTGAEETLSWVMQSGFQYVLLSNTGAKPKTALQSKLAAEGSPFECRPGGQPLPAGLCYTAADAQVDFMTSGHLPAASKLLVLAPDDLWEQMLRQREPRLFESWDIRRGMDVTEAKEWSQLARARLEWEQSERQDEARGDPPPKVAVVLFSDGEVASDWSYERIHAITVLLGFGAEFIYTAEDSTNPSIDERYPDTIFPMPGPGMFAQMLKRAMPPSSTGRSFCCGKGGNVGRTFMIDRAIEMLKQQGHSGERDQVMIVGDRFDTDIRAGVLAGIKSCLIESGAHSLDMADQFPVDVPSYTAPSVASIAPSVEARKTLAQIIAGPRALAGLPCAAPQPRLSP